MYSTKVFNAKVAESYLNIGDPYSKQALADGRVKGRQFLTNPSRTGQLAGYFSPFSYATDSYQDSNAYIVTQPRDQRKLGFGTHDANRRDEFTLDIRAKQYRQLMVQEKNWEKDCIRRREERAHSAPAGPVSDSATMASSDSLDRLASGFHFQTAIPALQYDIGRSSAGVTPDCAKCERDTFYCPHRLQLSGPDSECRRRQDERSHYSEQFGGDRKLSAIGQGHPTFSHRSSLRDFQDSNHLSVGKGF